MRYHNTIFTHVMTFIHRAGVTLPDIRLFATFGWAVVGAILSERPHVSQWALYRPGAGHLSSKARQLSRWLHNERIEPMAIYRSLLETMWSDWPSETLYVAMDTTLLWKRFVIIRLALVYGQRSIPLGWVVRAGRSASVPLEAYQPLLSQVGSWLPAEAKVVLLADRGFHSVELLKFLRDLGWHYRLRLKANSWLTTADWRRGQVAALMPPPGKGVFLAQVWVTDQQFGPLHLALAHVLTPQGPEPWAILSDEPVGRATLDEYGLRFCIEESFRDDKSGGFNLESSRLYNAHALSRLCLILATATLYLVATGQAVEATGFRFEVDTHWRRGLSFLQIGWRWCKKALASKERMWLLDFPWLPWDPDPEPVIASWPQFFQPRFSLKECEFL